MGKYAEICGKKPTEKELDLLLGMIFKYLEDVKEDTKQFSLTSGKVVKKTSGIEDIFKAIFFKTPKYDFYLKATDPSQYGVHEVNSLNYTQNKEESKIMANSLKLFLSDLEKNFPFTQFSSINVRNLKNIYMGNVIVKEQKDGYVIIY